MTTSKNPEVIGKEPIMKVKVYKLNGKKKENAHLVGQFEVEDEFAALDLARQIIPEGDLLAQEVKA